MRSVVARAPYFFVHFVRSKGQRTWQGARNFFYDYFVTPYVAFVPSATVEGWCAKHAVRVMRYDENRGANVHSFCIVKERPQETRNPSNSPAEAVLSD
jgi:hypothetical protein